MIDRIIDRADATGLRWRTPLAVVSGAWFAVTCADYAGFVDLPTFNFIPRPVDVLLAGAWNAIWWGWLYPRAERRRTERGRQGNMDHG